MKRFEGFGHVPRSREFTIDDQSSSEHPSQTATGSFRPPYITRTFKTHSHSSRKTTRQKTGRFSWLGMSKNAVKR